MRTGRVMQTASESAPLVSVITIFLNAERFFCEAVDSVVQQTYPHWELLLVDDGSTDGTSRLARDYERRLPGRIRYLEHAGHARHGMSASRNLGIDHARGALVAFLDADDKWTASKLASQVTILAAHPAAQMVSGPTHLWYGWTGRPEDRARDAIRLVSEPMDTFYTPPELLRRYLTDRALTPATCSVLIRREAIERVGGFENRFRGLYEDQAFFLKAYLKLPTYLASECTDFYRQHPSSHMALARRTGQYFEDRPARPLVDLCVWLTQYLIRQKARDRVVWTSLFDKLARLGVYQAMTALNRFSNAALVRWHERKKARTVAPPRCPVPDQGDDDRR